jgi:D-lactate dehydrogenase
MRDAFEYDGLDTCAADGMCQEKCPVKVRAGAPLKESQSEPVALLEMFF